MTNQEWDQFVTTNGGSVYQLYGWQSVCHQVFGYLTSPEYLLRNGKIVGVMPGVCRGLSKKQYISMPFVDCAGPLVSTPGAGQQLISEVKKKYPFWEIYSQDNYKTNPDSQEYSIYELPIDNDYTSVFANKYHHKTRNMVRKSKRQPINVSLTKPSIKEVKSFAQLYQMTMKKIGVLTLPEDFFLGVFREFSDMVLFSSVTKGEKLVAGLWLFLFNEKIYVWANASEREYLSMGVNYLAYDSVIEFACNKKLQSVVLGASPIGSSQEFFKERWGATPVPVFFHSSNKGIVKTRWGVLGLIKPILSMLPLRLYRGVSKVALRYG